MAELQCRCNHAPVLLACPIYMDSIGDTDAFETFVQSVGLTHLSRVAGLSHQWDPPLQAWFTTIDKVLVNRSGMWELDCRLDVAVGFAPMAAIPERV